jgi:hypothetical protein
MLLAAAAATAMISSAAYAATLDLTTGLGFVGKGEVQLAYGWNNAVMQRNHTAVDFYLQTTARYEVECEWTTETGGKKSKTILHDVTKKFKVSDTTAIDTKSRMTGQWTGWNLRGYEGGAPDIIELPASQTSCPQGGTASDNDPPGNDAVVVAAYFTSEPVNTLYATHSSGDRELTIASTL